MGSLDPYPTQRSLSGIHIGVVHVRGRLLVDVAASWAPHFGTKLLGGFEIVVPTTEDHLWWPDLVEGLQERYEEIMGELKRQRPPAF